MKEAQNTKKFNLEDRTTTFSSLVHSYCRRLEKDLVHFELAKQLVRSAGSVGANYIEAAESLSKKDFIQRMKFCRKEARESRYWIFLSKPQQELQESIKQLYQEATELMKIFGSIVTKAK